jgi:hypothetical protein
MSSYFADLDENPSETGSYFSDLDKPSDKISKGRSLASAYPKGLLKGTSKLIRDIPGVHQLGDELQNKILEKFLPTRDETTERTLQRAGELTPYVAGGSGSLPLKIAELGLGTLGGQLAEESGLGELGQMLAEGGGMSVPAFTKGATKGISSFLKREPDKLKSGLTKTRVMDSKLKKIAAITSGRQEKTIQKLNEEAALLTEKSLSKHVPAAQKIRKGFDFKGKFEKEFGTVERLANRKNPLIKTNPLNSFFSKTKNKYVGIPNPHLEAKKIKLEIQRFRDNPQYQLKNLLKTFRSNNRKLSGIYERRLLHGTQREFADFLVDYNKAIMDSIKATLPPNSAFVRLMEKSNRDYKKYRNAEDTLEMLSPVVNRENVSKSLMKLADDPRKQARLALKMGQEGASEVVQISKDLKEASKAIKDIPVKDLKLWDLAFALSAFIPGIKLLGIPLTGYKGYKMAQIGLGYFLSSPLKRKGLKMALNAIKRQDLNAYRQAALILKNEEDPDEDEELDHS